MTDLVQAAVVIAFVLFAACVAFRAVRALVDGCEPGSGWGRTTFDDIYAHPDVGPAAVERPGPGQIPKEDLTP